MTDMNQILTLVGCIILALIVFKVMTAVTAIIFKFVLLLLLGIGGYVAWITYIR